MILCLDYRIKLFITVAYLCLCIENNVFHDMLVYIDLLYLYLIIKR
jgi:hypothetical protein